MDDTSKPRAPFPKQVVVTRNTIDPRKTPAKVQRVLIKGVARTKDDILEKQVTEPLMQSKTFHEVMTGCAELKNKLTALGIFNNIQIEIDTSKIPGAGGTAYDVYFNVVEKSFANGGIQSQVDQNSVNVAYSLNLPNAFGRAEKLMAEYTYGSKQRRGLGIKFTKPLNGNTDVMLGTMGYQGHTEYPNNGFKETNRGVSTDISFPSLLGKHNISWEGVWRDLRCLTNTASFAVREQAGHSLKSSLIHTFIRDSRDDPVFPSKGTMLKITQEYAGLGGNAKFFKNDIEIQANKSLIRDAVLQLSLAGGIMRSLEANRDILINDRFFLGGPLTLRGFNFKGVGPHKDGNILGGDAYVLGALHLYSPLPFRRSAGGFWDMFRAHAFVNAGNCGQIQEISMEQLNRSNGDMFRNSLRLAYGAGIAFRFGMVRLELNYTVPIWAQKGDSTQPGVQLGVGIAFL